MNFKSLSLWSAAAGIILLVGCNLYNPNGAEEGSCPSNNAECYIALGQSLVQQKSFTASMDAYAKAIEIDSTKSEAYWGYATAASFKYNISLARLLDDLQSAGNGNPTAFTDHPNDELTARISVSIEVLKAMNVLSDRDTLTRWFGYLTDSSKASSDPLFSARRAFIDHYLDTVTAPSRQRTMFPLSDRKKKFEDAVPQYAPYLMMYTILNLYDLAPKGIFDDHDRIMMTLLSPTGDGLGNIQDLAEQMKTDTVLQVEVNTKILELQSGLGDLSQVLAFFGGNPSDTAGAPQQSKANIDSAISSLGGTLVFYQFGDHLDNDADGCIDEEIVDSLDNDLDGFTDEDARLITGNGTNPLLPGYTGPGDGIDNDRNGRIDGALQDPGENKFGGVTPAKDILTYVITSGHNDNFVEGNAHKDHPGMDYRIALQADSLAVHLVPGARPVPAQYEAKLDSAKTLVGGCWRNY